MPPGVGVGLGAGVGFGVGAGCLVVVAGFGVGEGVGAGFATVNVPRAGRSSGTPSRDVAAVVTATATVAPGANEDAGSNTSTVSSSAQLTRPVTDRPPTVTLKAAAVELRSIGWVKRTETGAPRATSWAPRSGRKRTILGASAVVTVNGSTGASGPPSASRAESAIRTVYVVPTRSGSAGTNVSRSGAAGPSGALNEPITGGSTENAAVTDAMSTGRSKTTVNEVPGRTWSPTTSSARIRPRVAGRMKNAARAGISSAVPPASRAVAATVTV